MSERAGDDWSNPDDDGVERDDEALEHDGERVGRADGRRADADPADGRDRADVDPADAREIAGAEDPEFAANRRAADEVYASLLSRVGESRPQPRLSATRRAVELLGDPHRAYPIIHITGTNGKTSTSRISESILRAYGLRTGLLTSPHLVRFNERIQIDGVPISDESLVRNWDDVRTYIEMVDAQLEGEGEPRLTYFEALTVLAFAAFADAPVDVAVIEVGMGGEWDSTNVADGQVAVFTPISLDHQAFLGDTIAEIARTKAGIIKPAADVVTSAQRPDALAELTRAAQLSEATIAVEGDAFELTAATVAVGGQLISVRGRAGEYRDLFLPLYGDHQAHNAAVAIAAVETFLGRGTQALTTSLVEEGLAAATSPGRLQSIGTDPAVIVDAAHNPAGAASLTQALRTFFDFDEIAVVLGVLGDKDAEGIVRELAPIASRFVVTRSDSDRAIPAVSLSRTVRSVVGSDPTVIPRLGDAIERAREWASETPRRAVVITGSITLVGEALEVAAQAPWGAL